MLEKSQINMKLLKIQSKLYDLEGECYRTTDEINGLINQISELVLTITEKHNKPKKLSNNLYSVKSFTDYTPGDEAVDLTKAVATALEDDDACLYCEDGTELIIEKPKKRKAKK